MWHSPKSLNQKFCKLGLGLATRRHEVTFRVHFIGQAMSNELHRSNNLLLSAKLNPTSLERVLSLKLTLCEFACHFVHVIKASQRVARLSRSLKTSICLHVSMLALDLMCVG
jgi:hypothetical protein